MLKRVIAFLLLLALFSANFSSLFVYTGFELNQQYIATTLCINRNNPEMHCNGQCYLMKKLKETEQKEQKQERETHKNNFQKALLTEKATISFFYTQVRTLYFTEALIKLPKRSSILFHPPRQYFPA